ncbi:glycosyltransferase [Patescibacteria group bacterium]|nr:glycosyltransferase [Patescibacteria group bacterium]
MKVALVYDRVNKWGGAERVLLALNKMFPDAPLYTSVYNPKGAKWAKRFKVKHSFLQKFPNARKSHEFYAPLMPLVFETFDFDDYDIVISVSSEAAKGVITSPYTIHICYCLTPTRYLWSGYNEYFKNSFLKVISKPMVKYLRKWEIAASKRPDIFIAISTEVQNRIADFYNRTSEIIHPPLFLASSLFKPEKISNSDKDGFFLVVSRLIPYKKIDLAIKACNELSLPLKIVGIGSQGKSLRKLAGPTVEFLGNLTDEELSFYYKNCKALIFPGIEDFGLVMVEAQAFGKPVIAFKGGGALDIVKNGETGVFFNEQSVASLKKVLKNFDSSRYNSLSCKKNADRFSFDNFKKNLMEIINSSLKI